MGNDNGQQLQQQGDGNTAQGAQAQQQGGVQGPKGQPDEGQKQRREANEARIKELEAELAASQQREKEFSDALEKAMTEDDVKAAVEEANKTAQTKAEQAASAWANKEKGLTVTNALLAAGCHDPAACMAHIDMDKIEIASDGHISGLDTKGLSESYPYLFGAGGAQQQNLTPAGGVSSAASPSGGGKKLTKAEIVAIKDARERRRAIAENMNEFE